MQPQCFAYGSLVADAKQYFSDIELQFQLDWVASDGDKTMRKQLRSSLVSFQQALDKHVQLSFQADVDTFTLTNMSRTRCGAGSGPDNQLIID